MRSPFFNFANNGAETELKAENARLCLPMLRVCAAVSKVKFQMKFVRVAFFISDYVM